MKYYLMHAAINEDGDLTHFALNIELESSSCYDALDYPNFKMANMDEELKSIERKTNWDSVTEDKKSCRVFSPLLESFYILIISRRSLSRRTFMNLLFVDELVHLLENCHRSHPI